MIIYGETGVTKLEIPIYQRMISFWHNIRCGKPAKLSTKLYQLQKYLFDRQDFESKWCNKIQDILNRTGLSYLWNYDRTPSFSLKNRIKQRLNDAFMQTWSSSISENPLCINYNMFKTDFEFEFYLQKLPKNLRIPLAKYRCGSHNLPISVNRFDPIDDHNMCPLGHCATKM